MTDLLSELYWSEMSSILRNDVYEETKMITRTAEDEYHVLTLDGSIDIKLSQDKLMNRLRPTGIWSEDGLRMLREFEIGQHTVIPYIRHE